MVHADTEDRGSRRIKRLLVAGAALVVVGLGLWMGLKPTDWQTWLGFSKVDYFQLGTNYAFASGPGPMILTAVGMSTIIASLWRAHNCHQEGCYRIGRHKVNGTPWCNVHHESARHEKTTEQLLAEQNKLLEEQNRLLRQLAGLPDAA